MDTQTGRKRIEATLVFPVGMDNFAMARKKKKIGAGMLNGWGGEIEPGEDEVAGLCRELFEESAVTALASSLQKMAVVLFHNEAFDCNVHVYFLWRWRGLFQETDEMGPAQWFKRDYPPLEEMMPADRDWLPKALLGHPLIAEVWYADKQSRLLRPTFVAAVPRSELPRLRSS